MSIAANGNVLRALESVTAIELAAIKRDRATLKALKQEYAELAESLRQREADIIERIEAGAYVDGAAQIIERRRQNISWLTVCKRHLGTDAVIEAKNEWPVTFYQELRID